MTRTPPGLRRAIWPASTSRPVASPLQPSVVYASLDPDGLDAQYETGSGYTYGREGHPNADVVAGLIDDLEGAEGGIVVSSGMAAVTLGLLGSVGAGDHVIGSDQLYGRSLRLLKETLPALGIETTLVDVGDLEAVERACKANTRIILVETVSNPMLRVADLSALSDIAKRAGSLLAVDNTFTTPRGLQPLSLGADIVIHSVTKLLAGHSDATLGYVVAANPEINAKMAVLSATMGFTPSPFDCWLAERGLYSFHLRHDRVVSTAQRLADALAEVPGVVRVIYPGRTDHPDHNQAVRLLGDKGGNMVSFEITGGRDAANRFVRAVEHIPFAPTLGDIGTTISHPATSSHRALSDAERSALGITEGFFRVSVGCEDPDTLVSEFVEALRTTAG